MSDPAAAAFDSLARTVFAHLQDMDACALPTAKGVPTGLNWYGGHAEAHLKRPRTEPSWSRELAKRFAADCEKPYPAPTKGCRCDVVVTIPEVGELWLEIKGAWKEWWRQQGREAIYHAYLRDDPVIAKSHTAQKDITKLRSLPTGRWIGFLLLGFDTPTHPMRNDIEQFQRDVKLVAPRWRRWDTSWNDPHRPTTNEQVHAWLWIAPH